MGFPSCQALWVDVIVHQSETGGLTSWSNHFTVRLPRPLHLPGEGWKMGLSSLSLPDTRANLYRLVPKQQYLFSLKWFVLPNGKRTKRRTTVQMDDIDHLDSVVDGEHFMRAIIQHLESQRRRGRHGDLFLNNQASHWYVKWDWVRHGGLTCGGMG